ncbi:MAG: hypothetical protein ABSD21_04155 [Rhizomicrobium sp.]|jgi:hypothetical protein
MLKRGALIILAVFLAAAAPIPKPSVLRPQHPPTQSESGALAKQDGHSQVGQAVQPPPPKEITDAVSRAIDAAAHKAEASQNPRPPDNSGWWFNFLLVIFTGGLVVVGAFQAIFLKASVDAGEKTAEAAKASADAVVSQLRAYIDVTVEITDINDPGPRKVTGYIKNTGQTPAYNVVNWMAVTCFTYPPPPTLTFERPKTIKGEPPKFVTLARDSTLNMFAEFPALSAGDLEEMKAGTKAIYVWGRVDYVDVFGKPRFTSFRRAQGGRYGFRTTQLVHMPDGNEAT